MESSQIDLRSVVTDPYGEDIRKGGPFPVAVVALDENFIIVRAEANLAVSGNLAGFHLYGTEICLIAHILGYRSYVIDFHVWHKSKGHWDSSFLKVGNDMIAKYERALRPHILVLRLAIVLSHPLQG